MRQLLFLFSCLVVLFSQSVWAEQQRIVVFAASSMTDAMQAVKLSYEKSHPQVKIVFSFASSSTLARQIEQGAPANIYISANQTWMDYLAKGELIDRTSRINIVANTLVLIAPIDSRLQQVTFTDKFWQQQLAKERLAVGDPAHVPAGIYAKQALENMGQWNVVKDRLARGNNVRAALALVERNEAPLGIVYASDVVSAQKGVKIIAQFPQTTYTPITYPAVLISENVNHASRELLHYLTTQKAQVIFQQYGFVKP